MRRITWVVAIVICLIGVLAGCGKKDAGAVVKDLDHVMNKLESYQGSGKMMLHTGQEPQEYLVEVSYLNPHYYRISLTNAKKDITQIVLRNDEGVFVLTPHLNKSFRFQSDWPGNQGQVYLFQSLVQSIEADNERQFTTDNDAYVFDVLANYQNATLSRQKIWLDRKTYAPKHVEVSDASANVMVVVDFNKFEFGKKFDKDTFDMQRNMTSPSSSTQNLPTVGKVDGPITNSPNQSTNAANGKTTTNNGKAAAASSMGVIEPSYVPTGVKQPEISDMKLGDDKAVLLRYTGTYHYSLVESRPEAREVSALPGVIVDLGYTLAVLTGDDNRTLTWTYDGAEFRLSSGDLPKEEMIKIAQTVQGQIGK